MCDAAEECMAERAFCEKWAERQKMATKKLAVSKP
jgi:hypothetical protein